MKFRTKVGAVATARVGATERASRRLAPALDPTIPPRLLTVEEAARVLVTKKMAVRRLMYAGKLAFVKVGRRKNIIATDIDAFVRINAERHGGV